MGNQTQSTIIMVDDDSNDLFMTRRIVRRDGFVNRFVSEKNPENLITTLDSIVEKEIDPSSFIILLDINMPRIDGFEMIKMLRSHDLYKTSKIIMLSGSKDLEDMFKAYDSGANAYLVKPFSGEEFIAALDNIPSIKKCLVTSAD